MKPNAEVSNAPDRAILIIDDDEALSDTLAEVLAIESWSAVACHDLEAAKLLIERSAPPAAVVTDLRFSNRFTAEGFNLISTMRKRAGDVAIVGMSAEVDMADDVLEHGATAFLSKPFDPNDLISILEDADVPRSREPHVAIIPSIDAIIASGRLIPNFQPIVNLTDGRVHAYEALIRFQTHSPLRAPDLLFAYAQRKHRAGELDLACMRATLQAAENVLTGDAKLFMNVHPDVFAYPEWLVETIREGGESVDLSRVVLEITEHTPIRHEAAAMDAVHALRDLGVRFALDDMGAAHSHLAFVNEIHPKYMKIGDPFSSTVASDSGKRRVVEGMVALARALSCEVVLETIENSETAEEARRMGIAYGQGYYFGRPAPAAPLAA